MFGEMLVNESIHCSKIFVDLSVWVFTGMGRTLFEGEVFENKFDLVVNFGPFFVTFSWKVFKLFQLFFVIKNNRKYVAMWNFANKMYF